MRFALSSGEIFKGGQEGPGGSRASTRCRLFSEMQLTQRWKVPIPQQFFRDIYLRPPCHCRARRIDMRGRGTVESSDFLRSRKSPPGRPP
jgi:hypothetical protein